MLAARELRGPVGMVRFQNVSPHIDSLAVVHVDQAANGFEKRVIWSSQPGAPFKACPPTEFCEAVSGCRSCVDFVEFGTSVAHKSAESRFGAESTQVIGETYARVAHRRFQVSQHRLLGDAVQLERASRWEQGEVRFNGTLDLMAGSPQQGLIAHVVAVLAPNLAHEVEDGKDPLPLGPAQPSSQLLEKYRSALGGAQHEHGVDLGQIDT